MFMIMMFYVYLLGNTPHKVYKLAAQRVTKKYN